MAQTVTTGIFVEASAHHRFNKNATQIKKVYKSIYDSDHFNLTPTGVRKEVTLTSSLK